MYTLMKIDGNLKRRQWYQYDKKIELHAVAIKLWSYFSIYKIEIDIKGG